MMFNDWSWLGQRSEVQQERLAAWLVELGAGRAIATVRHTSERVVERLGGKLIRLNPREQEVPSGHIGLPFAAAEGIRGICDCLKVSPEI